MTIEELWGNLKPMINHLENKVEKLEPLVGKVEKLELLVDEVKAMKEYMCEIQHVNMTSLIKGQTEIKQELKATEKRLTARIDKYLEKNEVEHKKIDAESTNLEWKNRIVN